MENNRELSTEGAMFLVLNVILGVYITYNGLKSNLTLSKLTYFLNYVRRLKFV